MLYDKVHGEVTLQYKDYRNRKDATTAAPMATKQLSPLVAIDQMMSHCLPLYFQKCRYYGIHASATYKKHEESMPKQIKNNRTTVRTVFQLIQATLQLEVIACENCKHIAFSITGVPADKNWKNEWLVIPKNRGSPKRSSNMAKNNYAVTHGNLFSMPETKKKQPNRP